jgi:hypothetical protein
MYKKVERLQEALSLAVKSLDELNFITQNNAANNILRFPNAEAIPQNDSEFISWIKGITKLRAAREKFFPSTDLFAEPAWDMLLDLSLSAIQRKKVSVTSLCIAARAPNTTALRWVNVLEKMGFIERTQD